MLSTTDIAKIAHQANKTYCESLGDTSQTDWNNAPDWQKESAIKGVEFHLANPDASASASHDSWLKEKVDAGWVYGAVKNPETKQHPCIVAYEELPKEQQAKDYLFRGIVHSLKDFIQLS